jgi:hypothetical protein
VAAPAAVAWRKVRRSMGWEDNWGGGKCKGVGTLGCKKLGPPLSGWATPPIVNLFVFVFPVSNDLSVTIGALLYRKANDWLCRVR